MEELRRQVETLLKEVAALQAEERRRSVAPQDGVPSKTKTQKSARQARISTVQKMALATRHEDIWPSDHLRSDCRLR